MRYALFIPASLLHIRRPFSQKCLILPKQKEPQLNCAIHMESFPIGVALGTHCVHE